MKPRPFRAHVTLRIPLCALDSVSAWKLLLFRVKQLHGEVLQACVLEEEW